MSEFEDRLPMLEKVIIIRYLIHARDHPYHRWQSSEPHLLVHDSNEQRYVCGYLAERMIHMLSAAELPEFLVSNDALIRECARSRLDELSVGG